MPIQVYDAEQKPLPKAQVRYSVGVDSVSGQLVVLWGIDVLAVVDAKTSRRIAEKVLSTTSR